MARTFNVLSRGRRQGATNGCVRHEIPKQITGDTGEAPTHPIELNYSGREPLQGP